MAVLEPLVWGWEERLTVEGETGELVNEDAVGTKDTR